ncbi:MAG: hypothetical protein R2716_11530 [Microthrixaceae bacterium]
MARTFWLETLGCPKNEVDSDKLAAHMAAEGMSAADCAEEADLVVVNTCAFVEDAREESVATILELHGRRRTGSELVVTGCMAERYGSELAEAMPEGGPCERLRDRTRWIQKRSRRRPGAAQRRGARARDGTQAERPRARPAEPAQAPSGRPWAYVKAAEGCDKACGFCAIPSFRGPQRSREVASILEEVDSLGVREVVLVAQDLGAHGCDGSRGRRRIVELLEQVGSASIGSASCTCSPAS